MALNVYVANTLANIYWSVNHTTPIIANSNVNPLQEAENTDPFVHGG